MFGLGSLKKPELKVMASNNFVNMISEAKKKAEQNYEKSQDDYDFIMAMALTKLQNLSEVFSKDNFLGALDNLEKAQKLKQNKMEPYFYLSWLFLMADEIDLATKYMNIINKIQPDFDGLNILKEKISEIQLLNTKNQKTSTLLQNTVSKPPVSNQSTTQNTMKQTVNRANSAYSAYNKKY